MASVLGSRLEAGVHLTAAAGNPWSACLAAEAGNLRASVESQLVEAVAYYLEIQAEGPGSREGEQETQEAVEAARSYLAHRLAVLAVVGQVVKAAFHAGASEAAILTLVLLQN